MNDDEGDDEGDDERVYRCALELDIRWARRTRAHCVHCASAAGAATRPNTPTAILNTTNTSVHTNKHPIVQNNLSPHPQPTMVHHRRRAVHLLRLPRAPLAWQGPVVIRHHGWLESDVALALVIFGERDA